MKVSNSVVMLALAVWGVCLAGAFWHLDWQYLRPVARPVGAADYKLQGRADRLPLSPLADLNANCGTVRLSGAIPVTLLNFWNPDCACSRFAEPHVHALVERFAPLGVRFVTVIECGKSAADRNAALTAWLGRGEPTMPVVIDPGGDIARRFGVWAAPGAVILDRQGRMAYIGSYNAARFCADAATAWAMQALQSILHGASPPHATTPFYGCQVMGRQSRQ
jgi:hypothetical protein